MKKLLSALIFFICVVTLHAQDKKQWSIVTNAAMKGANGLLIVSVPAESVSMNCMISKAGDTKNLYTMHNSTSKEFAPGSYDITFWGIKIPNVIVEQGKETRIFAGILNSSVKGLWEVYATDSTKIFSAGSPKQVALPVGNYVVKVKGAEFKSTINDGKVTMFSFTVY